MTTIAKDENKIKKILKQKAKDEANRKKKRELLRQYQGEERYIKTCPFCGTKYKVSLNDVADLSFPPKSLSFKCKECDGHVDCSEMHDDFYNDAGFEKWKKEVK